LKTFLRFILVQFGGMADSNHVSGGVELTKVSMAAQRPRKKGKPSQALNGKE
jgi:hypothetical protein